MASTFVRGFNFMPDIAALAAIEGIVVVDNPAPGGLGGTPTNYACLVAEFADMTRCLQVDSTGLVTTLFRPDFVQNQADFESKFGGFDPTIGQFGGSMGNGYTAAVGKVFGTNRLLCLPVNLCSAYAGRLWRQLPTCRSATDPSPIVPASAAAVPAAYEVKAGNNRVHIGVQATFAGTLYYSSGVDGAVTAAGMAATSQSFTSATGDFLGTSVPSSKVSVGDLIVIGVLGAPMGLGANASTYRVRSVTNGTTLVLELLDGSSFNWTTTTGLPWRIYPALVGDTGGNHTITDPAGYTIPARPLDATISAATICSPTVAPPAPSATTWAALSGLKFSTHITQPLTYTAAVQAPGAASSTSIDVLYQAALDGLLGDRFPASTIGGVCCARKSQNIALYTRQHCQESFAGGHPRIGFIAPAVNVNTPGQVTAASYPGVEPLRDAPGEINYYWPPIKVLPITAAVGTSIATADGQTTVNGDLDMPMDEYAMALFTMLPPEESPGKASAPVPQCFATIVDYARGIAAPSLGTYELLKSRGVCAVKIDTPPAQIQSAVNTVLPTQAIDPNTAQNRRAFANFLIVSLSEIAKPSSKELATASQVDHLTGAIDRFLTGLGPEGSGFTPQRIKDFQVTRISTSDEEDLGVYKFKVDVKMLSTMDYIVLSVTASPTVTIVKQLQ